MMHALCKPGDTIVVDGNAHYTTHMAAERNQLNIAEVPSNDYPEYRITPESFREELEYQEDYGDDVSLAYLPM